MARWTRITHQPGQNDHVHIVVYFFDFAIRSAVYEFESYVQT